MQARHARHLHDSAIGRETAFKAHDAAGGRDGVGDLVEYLLVRVPGDLLDILAQRLAGHRHRVGIKKTAIEQRLHTHVDTARLVHVLGDVFTAGLQVRDVRG